MKTITILITTLFAWSALASNIIVDYDYGITNSFEDGKFVQAVLSDDGQLSVSVFETQFEPNARPAAEKSITASVSEKNLEMVANLTRSLMSVKVVTTTSEIICMMMPSPFMESDHLYLNRAYDYDKSEFLGPIELVLGPEGCWVANRVHPEGTWSIETARKIKSIMQVLVNEHASEIL